MEEIKENMTTILLNSDVQMQGGLRLGLTQLIIFLEGTRPSWLGLRSQSIVHTEPKMSTSN